ncbi:site-2 protease. Metallo peptidase. MEROPS family M50B [Carnobacterium iners]|uniref:Zinc metalloprotease n=1 Tax=Carnobacterium iners TaxID=1073423 RepID=A0A1X7NGS9_9LACT|nr:RIP metalloprotease RseP [Carnobacterium iners]SEK80664.1 site-2 protease. Metallo peptidase. MEROPS family M50B [Carnobacterium iners]SMH36946.1 site-2 protease. Metallo peptidase. MEROPS family M50B [Carnobacterium iners]
MITTIITFILVFSVLVIFHEFGHYYFAKKAGTLVREFAIGFGPKIFSYRKNETTFTVRILPIGGYVRMAGYEEETEIKPGMSVGILLDENDEVTTINTCKKKQLLEVVPIQVSAIDLEKDLYIEGYLSGDDTKLVRYSVKRNTLLIEEDGTEVQIAPLDVQFQAASLPQRMMTNFAGPMNNIILAIITFTLMAFLQGGVISNENELGSIVEGSPAYEAGLAKGDQVLAIDGNKMTSWTEIVKVIQKSPEKSLKFTLKSVDGSDKQLNVIPEAKKGNDDSEIGIIGVNAPVDTSFTAKLFFGFTYTWTVIVQILAALGSIFTKGFSIDMFGGPVAIYATTEAVVKTGYIGVLNWMGILSINLGIINLLPVPALDGGKLLLNAVEGVRGKPLSQEKEGIITLIGVGLLALLMVLVTWNDIQTYFLK